MGRLILATLMAGALSNGAVAEDFEDAKVLKELTKVRVTIELKLDEGSERAIAVTRRSLNRRVTELLAEEEIEISSDAETELHVFVKLRRLPLSNAGRSLAAFEFQIGVSIRETGVLKRGAATRPFIVITWQSRACLLALNPTTTVIERRIDGQIDHFLDAWEKAHQ